MSFAIVVRCNVPDDGDVCIAIACVRFNADADDDVGSATAFGAEFREVAGAPVFWSEELFREPERGADPKLHKTSDIVYNNQIFTRKPIQTIFFKITKLLSLFL